MSEEQFYVLESLLKAMVEQLKETNDRLAAIQLDLDRCQRDVEIMRERG